MNESSPPVSPSPNGPSAGEGARGGSAARAGEASPSAPLSPPAAGGPAEATAASAPEGVPAPLAGTSAEASSAAAPPSASGPRGAACGAREEPGDAHDSAGRGLVAAGFLTLPLGLGAGLGYWAADRGLLWYPLLGGLFSLWIAGALAAIAGFYLRGPVLERRRGRRRIVALSLLVVLLAGGKVAVRWATQETALTTLGPAFAPTWAADAAHYRELDRALSWSVERLGSLDAFARAAGRSAPLRADEEAAALDCWTTYLDAARVLDETRRFYEDYTFFDPSRLERDAHVRSFLLTFAAELSLYERTTDLVDVLNENADAVKFLDLERPERGLPAHSVAFVREELAGLTDLSRVVAGQQYLYFLDRTHGARALARANGYEWLWREVEEHLGRVLARGGRVLAARTLANDLAPLQRKLKRLVFPVQKGVAEWMGDTKVRRRGRYLIAPEQLRSFARLAEPGDVLLGRKNWYLSNLGLPGFWPHAMLYVGSREQLAAAFDQDPGVRSWVARAGGREEAFTAYLARTYPRAWAERAAADPEHPLLLIEAISEGVVQNSLEHAAGDYLAALRPRLPAWVKARAVARAFGFLGRPYDFDFDFATDDRLVCSELVWRSYRPQEGVDDHGLRIDTVTVAGRRTLPANEFARLFRRERDREGRQLDFVAFLEGVEARGTAVARDEAAFLATVDRPKWDVLQR
ncbi:MAG: hypothetical protein D6731_10690 [Planctomycetota bacterium]|nr:MAG: hypothetical protein D6731_10690 [Planctomycetota bacterium]